MKLNEIDKVEITCLVDNHVDLLLPSTSVIQRPSVREGWYEKPPIAEHGFSVVITFEINEKNTAYYLILVKVLGLSVIM